MRGADAGLQLCDHIDQAGNVVFAHACQLGCEGIVSKRVGFALPAGPEKMLGLDQGEEPSGASGAARGGRGLGQATMVTKKNV
jgi:hypothetical protein